VKICTLPEGSSVHTCSQKGWLYVVLNVTPDNARAFQSFTDKRYAFSQGGLKEPTWFMREDTFLEFSQDFSVFCDLNRVAA